MNYKETADLIKLKRQEKRNVFVCGNGGSAANAEHFSNDLFAKGVRAHCLNSNTSIMTMIANDYGYNEVFSKQVQVLAMPGDLVILLSCSGTSPNIIDVLEKIPTFIEKVKIFGGKGSFGDMETEHLDLIHKICEDL